MESRDSMYAYDIFCSHSSENSHLASKIVKCFEDKGYKVWFDKDRLKTGDEYNSEIRKAIDSSKFFLCLLSIPYSLSNYCKLEFHYSTEKGYPIYPIALDEVNEKSNQDAGDIFFKLTGKTTECYGRGVVEEEIEGVCESIIERIENKDYSQLNSFLNKYNDSILYDKKFNSYVSNEIDENLFATIKQVDQEEKDDTSEGENKDILYYLDIARKNNKHLLIYGKGGIGKTVRVKKNMQRSNGPRYPCNLYSSK
jgi:hypothetical protein